MQGSEHVVTVIVKALRQTRMGAPLNLTEIAQAARTTTATVEKILEKVTNLQDAPGPRLNSSARFKLASVAARLGALQETARSLTWQEFEDFGQDCLDAAGFETQRGLVFKSEARRWQIDIAARKGPMLLALDCKHWQSPNYSSKFVKAAEHQRLALRPLMHHMRATRHFDGTELWALPVILTLFDPRASLLDGVVLVSVGQLPDFLEHVTHYDPELPFVSDRDLTESPIS